MLLTQAHNTQLVHLQVSDIYEMEDTLPEMVGWVFHNNHMLVRKQMAPEDKKKKLMAYIAGSRAGRYS